MTICPACGREIAEPANFCPYCGERLTGGPSPDVTTIMATIDDQTLISELTTEEVSAIEALPEGSALLIVEKGPNAGARYLLKGESAFAGRQPKADILLDDITVSRKHSRFTYADGHWRVEDAGSLNGTYVNRQLITAPTVLRTGDDVQIGKYRMVFFTGHHGNG
ncbi:MAG: zinc-ribbon and FHA domain-containing protein [Propionibacteriaceae bacterium]|jgi:pSer/pThr/pTyr-binding forkhead associated (FHA) protein|nr:zinc-ribbon and FHA domain-containing protein [Propionibacteriaceae bacterium]